tara:strand:+ start:200 stop:694 length:495 start_codon:yes stop_codon:yes gene_type:complete
MSNSQRTVRYRGYDLPAEEYRIATSLERLFKNVWVRKESFLDLCREKSIDPQVNELNEPIIPIDFQPKLSQVRKFRRKFNKSQKERITLFQAKYRDTTFNKAFCRRMTSMDDWYKEGLYLFESSTCEEFIYKLVPEMQDKSKVETVKDIVKTMKKKIELKGSLL